MDDPHLVADVAAACEAQIGEGFRVKETMARYNALDAVRAAAVVSLCKGEGARWKERQVPHRRSATHLRLGALHPR